MQCEWQIDDNCQIWCWPHLLFLLKLKGWSQDNILSQSKTTAAFGEDSYLLCYKGVDLAVLYAATLQAKTGLTNKLKVPFCFCFDDKHVRLYVERTRRAITFRPCDFPNPEQLYLLYLLLSNRLVIKDLFNVTTRGFINLICGFAGLSIAFLCEISRQIASELLASSQPAVYIDEDGGWYTNNEFTKRQLLQQLADADHNVLHKGLQHENRDCIAIITLSEWLDQTCDVLRSINENCKIIVISNIYEVNMVSSLFVDGVSFITEQIEAKRTVYYKATDGEHINLDDYKIIDGFRSDTMCDENSANKRVTKDNNPHMHIHIPKKRESIVKNGGGNIVSNNQKFSTMARKTSFEHQIELAESLKAYLHGFQERLGAVAKNYESKCNELYEAGMMDETFHNFEQNYMRETIISISKVVERINDSDIPFVEKYIDELENLRENHSR